MLVSSLLSRVITDVIVTLRALKASLSVVLSGPTCARLVSRLQDTLHQPLMLSPHDVRNVLPCGKQQSS